MTERSPGHTGVVTQCSLVAFRGLEILLALVGLEFVFNVISIDERIVLGAWNALALFFLVAGGAALW